MPVRLEITGDNADAMVEEFRRLNELTTTPAAAAAPTAAAPELRTVIEAMPLNDFMDLANAKLRPQGFKIVVDEPDVVPAPEPEPAPKKAKAKIKIVEPESEPEQELELSSEPEPAPTPSNGAGASPVGDDKANEKLKQIVIATLGGMIDAAPKRKPKVMAFVARIAERHGVDKIGKLSPSLFPEIKQEMDREFPNG